LVIHHRNHEAVDSQCVSLGLKDLPKSKRKGRRKESKKKGRGGRERRKKNSTCAKICALPALHFISFSIAQTQGICDL
jgi:hypothetical protein